MKWSYVELARPAMIVALAGLAAFFVFSRSGRITLTEQAQLAGARGELYTLTTGTNVLIRVAALPSSSARWDVVSQEAGGRPSDWIAPMTLVPADAVLACNGGYFVADGSPDGLWVVEGEARQPLSDKSVLSGVVALSQDGLLILLARDDRVDQPWRAIQSGPWLIDPGGHLGIAKDDGRRFKRTVLAETTDGHLLVVATTPASLFEVATVLDSLHRVLPVGRVERALNLDGGPSAMIMAKTIGGVIRQEASGPVHHVVVLRSSDAED